MIGVIIIFKFGLPPKTKKLDNYLSVGNPTPEYEQQIKIHNKRITIWANIGLACIIIGFLLQIIGTNR